MSVKFLMTVGLDLMNAEPGVEDENKFKDFIKSFCQHCKTLTEEPEFINADSVIMSFDSAEKAELAAEKFLETCDDCNLEGKDDFTYCYLIALDGGESEKILAANTQQLLNALRAEARERVREGKNQTAQVVVTKEVFNNLAWKRQDLYGPTEVMQKLGVHRRYPADALQCFVISPIGLEGTETRERADYVFNTFIKPACDGTAYQAIRGDSMTGLKIMDEVMEALQTAPMVIAYLGLPKPEYNPNVMLEVGCRLVTGLPIVILWDGSKDGKPPPFDVAHIRMIEIPASGSDEPTVTTIRRRLNESWEGGWKFPHTCATIVVNTKDKESNRFIEASPELEDLFEIKGLVRRKLDPVLKVLIRKMPEWQREPFGLEQDRLIDRMNRDPIFSKVGVPIATIPIVFREHKKYKGRAILPVIGGYSLIGDLLKLRLLYLDVTCVVQQHRDGYYFCNLSDCSALKIGEKP